jgi:hypothetical protein
MAPLRPPAHSIWATSCPHARPPGRASRPAARRAGRGDGTGAEERLSVDVERVVRRPVDGGPRTGGEREPAGAGVRRRLRLQTIAGCLRALAQQLPEPGYRALAGVGLDPVLHETVGGEEQQLVPALLICPCHAAARTPCSPTARTQRRLPQRPARRTGAFGVGRLPTPLTTPCSSMPSLIPRGGRLGLTKIRSATRVSGCSRPDHMPVQRLAQRDLARLVGVALDRVTRNFDPQPHSAKSRIRA